MFRGLYLLTAGLLYILALPLLVPLSFKKKYRQSVPARFFLRNNPSFEAKGVWFHSCSLGETKALEPMVRALEGKEPVNITTITATGQAQAQKYNATARYLPFELFLPFWVREQRLLVVLEAELWYLLFFTAKRKGAKTLLVSARLSERSYPGYLRFRWLYKRIFENIDQVLAQSEGDKERLEALGAKNVTVAGNIKLFQKIETGGWLPKPEGLTVTAASTHEGEEEIILEAWRKLGKGRLVIAPRHPERFEKVAKMARNFSETHGYGFHRFSEEPRLADGIVLLDTLGDLLEVYHVSDLVVLGGSFVKVGGHNPLEPVHFGCKVVTGPHVFNQTALFRGIEGVVFAEADTLAEKMEEALEGPTPKLVGEADMEIILEAIRNGVA